MLKTQIQFALAKRLLTGRIVLLAFLLFTAAISGFSQATSWTGGGGDFLWTNPANWSSGVPVNNTGSVTIPADVASPITAVPTISLAGLTINGSCWLQGDAIPASPNTITVTSSFSVAATKTFQFGFGAVRINFILSSSASGTINGTVSINSGITPRFFQNDGDLTISSTGLINETASPSIFTLGATGTLRIGSPAGITSAGASGNIQVTSARNFSTAANYVYNGIANQAVGNGLPVTINNLTIANTGGGGNNTVTLSVALAISNNLIITSGSLTAPASTLTISGNFINSGTFNNNGGTVNFNGGTAQTIAGANFNIVNLTGAGIKNATGNINVAGALTNSSTFDVGTNTLVAGSITNGAGVIRFGGATNGFAIGTGVIEYNGPSQTVGAGVYQNLTISQTTGEALLASATTVNGSLNLNTGNLNLGASVLTIGSAGSISGASASKFIIATGGGELRKNYSAVGSFTFPIGDNTGVTEYSPITVNVTSGGGFPSFLSASVTDLKHPNNASPTDFLTRYWNLTTGITSAAATISASYPSASVSGTEANISTGLLRGVFNVTTNPWLKFGALAANTLTSPSVGINAGQNNIITGIIGSNPIAAAGTDKTICNAATTTLGGTPTATGGAGGYTYSWSPAGGLSATTVANPVFTASAIGTITKTVVATDANGFVSAGDAVDVIVNPLPSPVISGLNSVCANQAGVVYSTPSTGNTYAWSITNGTITAGAGTRIITVTWNATGPGILTLQETLPVTFCSVTTANYNVAINPNPTPVITSTFATVCAGSGGATYSTAGTGNTYSWSVTNGTITAGAGTNTITVLWNASGASGNVQLTETTPAGCSVVAAAFPVTLNPLPTPVISGSNNVCANQAGVVYSTPSSGNTYGWAITNGTITAGAGTRSITVTWNATGPGTLQLTESLPTTCSVTTAPYSVTINPNPTPNITSTFSTVCAGTGGTTYSTAGTGNIYSWSVSNGTITAGAGTNTITVLWNTSGASGNVQLTETTSAGCSVVATVFPVTLNPLPTPAISGANSVCANQAGVVYTTPSSGNTYVWTITNGTITAGAGTRSITVTWNATGPGTLQLTETLPTTCSVTTAVYNVAINPNPTPSITSSFVTVCAGTGGTTYSTAGTGNTYSWSVTNGAITAGAGTNTITVLWNTSGASGSVQLTETTSAGCSVAATPFAVTLNPLPTPAISGSNSVCANQTGVVYSTPSSGNTYVWAITNGTITAGAGTRSITVTWNATGPGTLQLTETLPSTCAITTAAYNVAINPNPTPVVTSAFSTVCAGQGGTTYSTAGTGNTYSWSVTNGTITAGAGTNTITVLWNTSGVSGSVQLTEITSAGCSIVATSFPVTFNPLPTPVISGSNSVCANQAGVVYSTPGTGNTYVWSITNGTINAGAGTSSITVTWNATGPGTLQLTETLPSSCAVTTAAYNVAINPLPTPSIVGSVNVCANATNVSYSITAVAGRTYAWSVVSGGVISGPSNGSSVLVNWGAAGAGTLQVTETITATGCSAITTPYNVTINPNPAPIIAGPSAVCQNQTAVAYSVANVPLDSYIWLVTGTGASIVSGQNTSSIVVDWGTGVSGTVQVTETSGAPASCPTTVFRTITINPLPIPLISGSASVCAGSTVGYSTPTTAGRTFQWFVTGGAFSGSSTVNNPNVIWGAAGSGTLQVRETITATGCNLLTASYPVTIRPLPTPSVTGTSPICVGQSATYSTPLVAGNNYSWSVNPGGSGTITAPASGIDVNQVTITWNTSGNRNVQVTETLNGCPVTSSGANNVTVTANPGPVISGLTTVCANQSGVVYSRPAVGGRTFSWTVTGATSFTGAGTNSISVTWGSAGPGTVQLVETLTAAPFCSTATPVYNVTINPNPTPTITGPALYCANQPGANYSTPLVGGNTYSWAISGGTITSGAGTNSIAVTWGAAGAGTLTLTETQAGCSVVTTPYSVSIVSNPTPSITGSNTVCENQLNAPYSTSPAAGRTYVWTVVGGSIVSGAGTNAIAVDWGAVGAGSVQLTETITAGGCSVTTPTLIVNKNARPTPAITGSNSVCANETNVNYTTPGAGNIYIWTVSGGSIVSGAGTTSVFVNWGSAGVGSIGLTEISVSTGCVASTTLTPVTIKSNPSLAISGNNTVCANDLNRIYSVPLVAGDSYNWVATGGTINGSSTNNSVAIDWSAAASGTLQVTVLNSLGCSFTTPVYNVVINPRPLPIITGLTTVCANQSGVNYFTTASGNSFLWSVSGGSITAGAGTASITVNWNAAGTGTVSLVETNSSTGCSASATPASVTINAKPTPSIVGSNSVCALEQNKPYSTALVAGNNYNWSVTGGTVDGPSNANSVVIDWLGAGVGVLSLTETNPAGCVTTISAFNITINPTPTPSVTGLTSVCANQAGVSYSTPNVLGDFYAWAVTGGSIISGIGTNSIVVDWGGAGVGSVSVTQFIPASGCSVSPPATSVTINSNPTPFIAGNNTVCANDLNKIYSTALVAGNTYSWVVTGGTINGSSTGNSIIVDWGVAGLGTIQLTEQNPSTCTIVTPVYNVNINNLPSPSISGPATACALQTGVAYSTTNVPGNSYTWSVTGGSIISGNGSNSIVVNWGAAGAGSIAVTEFIPSSSCTTTTAPYPITINPIPTPSIGGDNAVCANEAGKVYTTPFVLGNTYLWSVTGGAIVGASTSNSVTVDWGAASTGTLTVTESAGCVASTPLYNVVISPIPTPSIVGTTAVCANESGLVYTTVNVVGNNYFWSVSGGTIVAGAGTNTITVNWGNAGTGVVILTETIASSGCAITTPSTIVAITPGAVVNAGTDIETCFGTPVNLSLRGVGVATASNFASLSWSGGTGSFSNNSIANPIYTPGALETGLVTLTLSATGSGTCPVVSDQLVLTITPLPLVSAGSDAEVCEGTVFGFFTQATPASASGFSSVLWTQVGGLGTIFNATTLAPSYQPAIGEVGVVTFTLTATSTGSCSPVTDNMQLTITPKPIANAGSDQEVCRGTTFNFSTQTTPASASNFSTIAWTTTGSGTFTNTTTLTPSYVAGAAESGPITFTLTATGNGSCATVTDQMVLTVTPQVVVNAGSNAETCQAVSINFGTRTTVATASSFNTLTWTGGAGTLVNANTLSPTYTPTAGETGMITFTLTATGNGSCATNTSTMQLTITPKPILNAGIDAETCGGVAIDLSLRGVGNIASASLFNSLLWSGGTGSFSSTSSLNPIYTPGVGETGIVVLTLSATGNGSCATVTDQLVLNVTPPLVVNAGSNAETCQGVSINFGTRTTLATASSFNALTWTGGAGTLVNANTLSPTYIPTAGEIGVVIFTLTATGSGSCALNTSTMQLTITPKPIVNAGSDQEVCRGTSFDFSTQTTLASVGNFNTIAWTTTGSGTFTNTTTLTPSYVAGAAESGPITFTLTATGNGSCTPVTDQMVLTVTPQVAVNAGSNAETCQGVSINFGTRTTLATASSFNTLTWTGGAGTLINANTLSPTYLPTAAEIGVVTFTLTATGSGSCALNTSTMQLTITPKPIVNAGSDQEVCRGATFNFSSQTTLASASNFNTLAWTTTGSGMFTNTTTLTPSYVAGAADSGPITFTLTATGNGSCSPVTDQMVLTVTPQVVVNAGSDAATCQGASINFGTRATVATAANFNTLTWTGGAGTLVNANTLNPTYTPTAGETGVITFTLTATGNGSCALNTSTMQLTITPNVVVNAGSNAETCQGVSINFGTRTTLATASNFNTLTWTGGAGTLANANTLSPTYTPTAAETGVITFTLTATGNGSCATNTSTMQLTITPGVVVNAGSNAETCQGVSINFGTRATLATAGSFNTLTWTGGAGTLINANTLSPTYTPTAGETGVITFTLTATGNGSCATNNSTMQLTITPKPIVNAGSDQEVCRGTTFNFSTQSTPASASSFNTIAWTTTGSGTFTNTTTLTPSYVAGAAESGPITFTLTATGNGGCATVTDQMVLNVTPQVVVNAGSNAETCQGVSINFGTRTTVATASSFNTLTWTGGAGTLVNANTLSPTYTPTAGETGVITFTLTATGNGSCATNNSTMQLTITPKPIVNAGSDQEVCRGTSFNFSAQTTLASAGNFNTLAWTTTGTGTFTNTTTLTPTYVAGVAESGPITFTLTATGNGSCTPVTDQMVLTVTPGPSANAGSNEEICQGGLFNFSTQSTLATVSNFGSLLWTHNGLGTLLSANSILPAYQATPAETGVLTFTLTVNGLGSCVPIVRTMQLTIRPSVLVNAGTNAETCQGVAFNFSTRFITASATNFTSLLWTHVGTGALANANTLSPTYVPGVGETGNVVFTLTANGLGVCPSKQSQMTLTITPLVTVDAGSNLQICQGSSVNFATQSTLASATNFSSVLWTHTGAGSLFNTTTLAPTYFASPTETGNVTFTLRAFSTGSCVSVTDVTTLNIVPAPLTNAGADAEVCEGSPTFSFGARAIPASSANGTILWTHNGAGTLSNNALINPVYTLSPLDFGNQITFTLTITSGAAVCSPVQDQFILKVNRKAIVSLAPNYTVCETAIIPLTGNIGGTATTALWTIVTGGGTLSATNVSGLTVTTSYNVVPADIGTTLTFRLTSNDPDGPTSPCTTEFADINVTINRATSISAGIDLAQCSNQTSIALQGVATYAPAGVSWSGGLGSFVSGSSPTGSYSFSNPLEISSTTPVTLTLTGNDPDGAGPCAAVTDQMKLTINPLPVVAFFGLPSSLAENNPVITLSGNQSGGLFTISPITSNIGSTVQSPILDKASFDPSAVTLGPNTVTYTFADAKGCTNSSSQGILINPVTTINWTIDASKGARQNATTFEWELCGNQGDVQLFGSPPPTGPAGVGVFSAGPGLLYGNALTVFKRGPDYFIDTNGAVSDTYLITYTFTNTVSATTQLSFNLNLFAKPNAIITTPPNNCVKDKIAFTQGSTIPPTPFSSTIDSYEWRFGDGVSQTNPYDTTSHRYTRPSAYNVILNVTTSKGCVGSTSIPIRAGDVPFPNYDWSSICTNAVTQFGDQTTNVKPVTPTAISTIINYTWDFGDLTPPLTGFGPTFKNPTHVYATPGVKTVRLRVDTDDGCNAFVDQTITILNAGPTVTPSSTTPYKNNFDAPDLDWFRESKVISPLNAIPLVYGANSWLRGTPSGSTITSTAGGTGAWWTGEKVIADQSASVAFPTYYGNEVSWVNGPCFDLRQLNRPMVALDYWSDVESNLDGAVLQYSVDGGITWEIVGPLKTLPAKDRDQGINWYDKDAVIQSNPGQQLSNGPFGWTGKSGKWKNARFNLDMVDPLKRNQVRVRVAFSSNQGNPQGSTDPNFDGFAFDNFFIGEKERIVLLEHFTNSSLVGSVAADAYLSNLYNNEITLPGRGGSDFNDIQYHIGFGSANSDPLNADNPNDPNARASSYGVSQPPKTFVDGLKNQKLDGTTTKLTNVEIDRRALRAPKFKLKLDTTTTTGINRENLINVRLTMVADTIVNTPLIAQVALVEDNVVTPNGIFKNVVRKLLFGSDPTKPDGITVTQTFTVGQSAVRPAQPAADVEINVPISNPNNLKLIGFVQDKNTGEIYQSTIMKVKRKVGSVVVGLEDDPLTVKNLKDLQIFPNPANGKFNFGYPGSFPDGYIWKIADQRGIFVLTGDFTGAVNGMKTIDVSTITNGVYYVLIGAEGKVPVYRKLVVMNQN